MTAKDLIAKLQEYPDDLEVKIYHPGRVGYVDDIYFVNRSTGEYGEKDYIVIMSE